jgi:uncharacterized membrane protein
VTKAVVRAEVRVAAPAAHVWDYVTEWPRQMEWIPLTRVEVLPGGADDGNARHVGGRFRAWTGVGPIGFWDPMTVTAWEEQVDGSGRCEILHTGPVVRGEGQIRVVAEGPHSCSVSLWERVDVPGGPVGALLWRVLGRLVNRAAGRVLQRMGRCAEGTGRG